MHGKMDEATEPCVKSKNNVFPDDAAPTTLSDILLVRLAKLEASQNQVAKLQARVAKLEATEDRVTQLEARVASLEAQVSSLGRDLVNMEDQVAPLGATISPTLCAAKNGHTSILAECLGRGADPNQDDGDGGTCLVASACYGRPECSRLLIQAGANVSYAYTGDNASVLRMLSRVFQDRSDDLYRAGDYILTADLLVENGAPVDDGLDLLYALDADEETKYGRELSGLIAVLEGEYWQGRGYNPFLHDASIEGSAWLLLTGAANSSDGHIDMTKVRSIKPPLRQSVLDLLLKYQGTREMLVPILLTMKNATTTSSFGGLSGQGSSILPIIAEFAGATGWSPQTMQEAIADLEESIKHFQTDDSFQDHDATDVSESDDEVDDGDY